MRFKLNKLKAIAAVFILASMVIIFSNDLKITGVAIVLKVVGIALFLLALVK